MEVLKKLKEPLFFLIISILTVPIVNIYIKFIRSSIDLEITKGTVFIIWLIINGIIILTVKNIILTINIVINS